MAELLVQDRDWRDYPEGTKAHAFNGGAWLRTRTGWTWNGHTNCPGSTFPRPGADAFGKCVELPASGVEGGSMSASAYLAKIEADPRRAAALQRARERAAGVDACVCNCARAGGACVVRNGGRLPGALQCARGVGETP